MKNNNKPYRVYRVLTDEAWGVEWRRHRYCDSKEEATAIAELRNANKKEKGVRYIVVHKSKEEAFAAMMEEKLANWKAYQKKLNEKARKLENGEITCRGGIRYNTRCSAHNFITGATRIA